MRKGFTLIELLAVIVILAIIALIATPIILNIINDAREESNERSVELYASAVRNAIAAYQLNNTVAPISFDQLDIEYDGDVECTTEELYEDGSFYIAGCAVNGTTVDYTYGEKQYVQIYKPQYYSYTEFSGTVGTTAVPASPSNVPPTDKNVYLGYDVTDGVVSAAYACFTRNETEYCLKGVDTGVFTTNTDVIKDAFEDVVDTDVCSFDEFNSYCGAGGLSANAIPYGAVYASDAGVYCEILDNGGFGCY